MVSRQNSNIKRPSKALIHTLLTARALHNDITGTTTSTRVLNVIAHFLDKHRSKPRIPAVTLHVMYAHAKKWTQYAQLRFATYGTWLFFFNFLFVVIHPRNITRHLRRNHSPPVPNTPACLDGRVHSTCAFFGGASEMESTHHHLSQKKSSLVDQKHPSRKRPELLHMLNEDTNRDRAYIEIKGSG